MGQKVNPVILRVGITRRWKSAWYGNKKQYGSLLLEDVKIKRFLRSLLVNAGVGEVAIERSHNHLTLKISTSKPALIIGKNGDNVEKLKTKLEKKFGKRFNIEVVEVKDPEMHARLVGENIAAQVERRIPYRRAVKSMVEKVMEAGALGVKIRVAGRLNGVEIARNEFFKDGNIPLHTLRADIDYEKVEAKTTYGIIGLQIWIYRGEKFKS